jgi:predicted nucleic acid-binding protein
VIALDSSILVAALLGWHERHEAAARALDRALATGDLVLPVPALVEAYAVLTRLPAPHRLSPSDALTLLEANFAEVRLASFSARDAWPMLRRLARMQLAGGITWDAVIVEAAKEAKAGRLLTLNPRDFERLDAGIDIDAV